MHYSVQTSLPIAPTFNQIHLLNFLPHSLFDIHFNIIPPSMSRSSKYLFPLGFFPHQTPVRVQPPRMCHKPDASPKKAKLIPIIQYSAYVQCSRHLSSLMPTWPCTTTNSKSVTWHLCVMTVCTHDNAIVMGDPGICTWISESRNFMELVSVS